MVSYDATRKSVPALLRAVESWHRSACLTNLPAAIGPLVDVDAQGNRIRWVVSDRTVQNVPLNTANVMARIQIGVGSLGIVEGVRTYARVTALTEFGNVEMPIRDGTDPTSAIIAHPSVGVAPLELRWQLLATEAGGVASDAPLEVWSDDRHGWNRGQIDERQLASSLGDVVLVLFARTNSPESWNVRATGELAGYTQLYGRTAAAQTNAERRA